MENLKIGDLVFIHIDILPFRMVAVDTNTWVNHVGIITCLDQPIVAESTFPVSKLGSLEKFVSRSKHRRVAIKRLPLDWSVQQMSLMSLAVLNRLNRFYDTGFNLHSKRQFCSKFVHEVVNEATGIKLGKVETLRDLFATNPKAHLCFWRMWYLFTIPWDRETITPASVFNDIALETIFDGYAEPS